MPEEGGIDMPDPTGGGGEPNPIGRAPGGGPDGPKAGNPLEEAAGCATGPPPPIDGLDPNGG